MNAFPLFLFPFSFRPFSKYRPNIAQNKSYLPMSQLSFREKTEQKTGQKYNNYRYFYLVNLLRQYLKKIADTHKKNHLQRLIPCYPFFLPQ